MKIDPKEIAPPLSQNAEHPDAEPVLMAKEYKFRPREQRLPEPSGVKGLASRPYMKSVPALRF